MSIIYTYTTQANVRMLMETIRVNYKNRWRVKHRKRAAVLYSQITVVGVWHR